jgi:hypothetical protein
MTLTEDGRLTEDERLWIAELDKKSVGQVKSEQKEYPPRYAHITARWISERELESERQRIALQSEQIELTRRQAAAAVGANRRATISLVVAALALVVAAINSWPIKPWLAQWLRAHGYRH